MVVIEDSESTDIFTSATPMIAIIPVMRANSSGGSPKMKSPATLTNGIKKRKDDALGAPRISIALKYKRYASPDARTPANRIPRIV